MSQILTGPGAMPCSRSPDALFYSGEVDDPLKDFLKEYEELADHHQLTNRQKLETVTRYIPVVMRDFWRSLDGYSTHDWDKFRQSLEEIYQEPSVQSRYSKRRLYEFAKYSSRFRMEDEHDVLQYYRRFLILSKPLIDSHRLTDDDRDSIFWYGFHPEDRDLLAPVLIWKNQDVYEAEYGKYEDVYKAARTSFSKANFSPPQWQDRWDDPRDARASSSERAVEWWLDWDERDPRGADRSWHSFEREREPPLFGRPRDVYARREPGEPRPHAPSVETKAVRVKDPAREEEDRRLEELITKMHGLSVRERSYAVLYAQCAHRFPDVAKELPKPEFAQQSSSSTLSHQSSVASLPPARQPWPRTSDSVLTTSPLSAEAASYFRPRPRIDGCIFCTHPSHHIRQCPTGQEYVRIGRAVIRNDRICLPDGHPIPNDGTGRGLKGSIDTWLAGQFATPLPQSNSSTFLSDAPPYSVWSFEVRNQVRRRDGVVEAHIVEVAE